LGLVSLGAWLCITESAQGQELLQDGDLEASLPNGTFPTSGDWLPSYLGEAGSICVPSGRTGNGFLLYTGNPTNDFWTAPYQDVVALPGQAYRGSAWIRTPPGESWVPGTRARVHVAFLNNKTNVLTSYESPLLTQPATPWQSYEVITEVAPAETAFVRFVCLLEKPKGVTGLSVAVFDDCSLRRTSVTGVELPTRALGIAADADQFTYTLRNTGDLPLNWRMEENLPWLVVEPTQGMLGPNSLQYVFFRVSRAGLTGTDCVKGNVNLVCEEGTFPLRVYMDMPAPPTPPAPAQVRTSGSLLVVQDRLPDGTLSPPYHYVIKGTAWSPSSRDTPEYVGVRRDEFIKWYVADIQMLREMNANTVYTFLDFGTNGSAFRVLDNLYKNGLKAIVTVDENGSGNTNKLAEIVTAYRQHPAILAWCIGNEWNINYYHKRFPPTPEGYLAAAALTEAMAQQIKALDPNHPVVSTHGDIYPPEMNTLVNQLAPSVDVWGLNVYRGPSFTGLFDDWASFTTKPMFLSEYGTDAYRTLMFKVEVDLVSVDGAVDEPAQADWNRTLWREIASHLSAVKLGNVCLGGSSFQWHDEWWKAQTIYGGKVGRHDNLGFYLSWKPEGHPDSVANEEWFGQVTIERQPRPAYFNYQADFAAVQVPADLDVDGLSDAWEYAIVAADTSGLIRGIQDVRPADDFDRDGASNQEEFVAGTDATSSSSVLRLNASRSPATGQVILRWSAVADRQYEVQSKPALPGASWAVAPGNVVVVGTTAEFVDQTGSGSQDHFYRLQVGFTEGR
jgi:hypothetical protein